MFGKPLPLVQVAAAHEALGWVWQQAANWQRKPNGDELGWLLGCKRPASQTCASWVLLAALRRLATVSHRHDLAVRLHKQLTPMRKN